MMALELTKENLLVPEPTGKRVLRSYKVDLDLIVQVQAKLAEEHPLLTVTDLISEAFQRFLEE